MACRDVYLAQLNEAIYRTLTNKPKVETDVTGLLFGVNTKTPVFQILQNNLTEFEWIVRNKVYPNYIGRYISGENCLTKDEIRFIHRKGCKIAAIYATKNAKKTEEQGMKVANDIIKRALELGIPEGTALFLEIEEKEEAKKAFMKGFAETLIYCGYTPAFKANTDAMFSFDREFSRGMRSYKEIFENCLIWAVAPTIKEYDSITTTHLIHPDNWTPFAPSAITRKEIAVWQYGRNCHPIEDEKERLTTFNLDLVRNGQVIINKMF